MKMRQMLKPRAIPTIFKHTFVTPKRFHMSSAVEKRDRARVTNLTTG